MEVPHCDKCGEHLAKTKHGQYLNYAVINPSFIHLLMACQNSPSIIFSSHREVDGQDRTVGCKSIDLHKDCAIQLLKETIKFLEDIEDNE